MGLVSKLRSIFAALAPPAGANAPPCVERPGAPVPSLNVGKAGFIPSFQPFKPERKNYAWVERRQQEEWEACGHVLTTDTYPAYYGDERFRSDK